MKRAEPAVTVYTAQNCGKCAATMGALDRADVVYDKVDVTNDPTLVDALSAEGHKSLPVVVTENTTWCDYRPDLIRQYVATPPGD